MSLWETVFGGAQTEEFQSLKPGFRAFEDYMEAQYVPHVAWTGMCGGRWVAELDAWDVYCHNTRDDVMCHMSLLKLMGKLGCMKVLCTFQDSFRDFRSGMHIDYNAVVSDRVVDWLVPPELYNKVVLVYEM